MVAKQKSWRVLYYEEMFGKPIEEIIWESTKAIDVAVLLDCSVAQVYMWRQQYPQRKGG